MKKWPAHWSQVREHWTWLLVSLQSFTTVSKLFIFLIIIHYRRIFPVNSGGDCQWCFIWWHYVRHSLPRPKHYGSDEAHWLHGQRKQISQLNIHLIRRTATKDRSKHHGTQDFRENRRKFQRQHVSISNALSSPRRWTKLWLEMATTQLDSQTSWWYLADIRYSVLCVPIGQHCVGRKENKSAWLDENDGHASKLHIVFSLSSF